MRCHPGTAPTGGPERVGPLDSVSLPDPAPGFRPTTGATASPHETALRLNQTQVKPYW